MSQSISINELPTAGVKLIFTFNLFSRDVKLCRVARSVVDISHLGIAVRGAEMSARGLEM